ncbi:hypothetical protein [Spiroplasma endosymbiont of Crioceris asparagi]|uniref:hypothetical protein n=1 Tax=Spiroplasma endosymbiont of Crioceris asparagi TaxID=3066286 RepID=UPI0030CC11C4
MKNSNNDLEKNKALDIILKSETPDNITTYKSAKKIRVIDLIAVVVISLGCIGIAFGISAIFKNKVLFEELTLLFGLLSLGLWFIVGYLTNRENAQMYNDHRRRYNWAINESNGEKKRLRKKLILIALLLVIAALIIYFTY